MYKLSLVYWLAMTSLVIKVTTVHGVDVMDCETESDIVFLVDSSASIKDSNPADKSFDNWQLIKDFIKDIIMRLPVEDKIRVGVLKFSNEVDTDDIIKLGQYSSRQDLGDKVNNLKYLGKGTNTSGAIWYVNEKSSGLFNSDMDRPLVPNYAILITDGLSNKDPDKTIPYARHARLTHNTKFFTVGLTSYANTDELQEIASDPVSYYSYISKDFRNLNVLLDSILTKMCPEAPPPEGPCLDTRADVTFLLDSSGSIHEEGWMNLKEFVVEVIRNLDLSPDKTRVAVIRYSTQAEVVFPFSKYFGESASASLANMRQTIMNLNYVGNKTNITGALKVMRRDVLTPDNGDRSDVKDIGILISDGKSTEDVNETSIVAKQLKSDGVAMFTIGLTDEINEAELINIASRPLSVYYLNTSLVSSVATLTSRLIWGVCIDQCGPNNDDPSCQRNVSAYRCTDGEKPAWYKYPNHILLGHNFDRLENVVTAEECKDLCYRDKKCRSVDYVRNYKQCAVSYIYKDQAMDSFVEELSSDYYELICQTKNGPVYNQTPPVSGSTAVDKSVSSYNVLVLLLLSVITIMEQA